MSRLLLKSSLVCSAIAAISLLGGILVWVLRDLEAVRLEVQLLRGDMIRDSKEISRSLDNLGDQLAALGNALKSLKAADKSAPSRVEETEVIPSRSEQGTETVESNDPPITTGEKVVQELGKEALSVAHAALKSRYDEFVKLLKEKAGIEVGQLDLQSEQVMAHIRMRYRARLDLVNVERELLIARLRRKLHGEGRYEEAPLGLQLSDSKGDPGNPSVVSGVMDNRTQKQWRYRISIVEFPEILEHDEAVKREFANHLDDVERFLSELTADDSGR